MRHRRPVPAQRQHPRLDAHRLELRRVEVIRGPRQLVKVDLTREVHLPRVNLHDLRPGVLVGVRELNLAIESAGAEQRGIEDVRPVRRRDDLHPVVAGEPVELVEQLEHGALHLAVAVGVRVESLGSDGVDLIDEDDRGRLLLGQGERVPHELGAVADEHLHQQRTRELQVRGVGLSGARAGDEGLAGSRRAVEQHTLGGADTQRHELIRVGHREDHRLGELLDLLVEAADVGVILGGLLVNLHRLDAAVVLGGQHVEDEVGVLIDADQIRGLELVCVCVGVGVGEAR